MTTAGDPFRVVGRVADAFVLAGPTPFDPHRTFAAIEERDGVRGVGELVHQNAPGRAARSWEVPNAKPQLWASFLLEQFAGARLLDVVAATSGGAPLQT